LSNKTVDAIKEEALVNNLTHATNHGGAYSKQQF